MRSIVLAVVGGLAGMLAMRATRRAADKLLRPRHDAREREARRLWPRAHVANRDEDRRILRNPEDAADRILGARTYTLLTGRQPSEAQTRALDQAVRSAVGLTMGGIYAALRSRIPLESALSRGALFGLALWALGDVGALPLLGLTDNPWDYPLRAHVLTLLGHLAFGAATALSIEALAGR